MSELFLACPMEGADPSGTLYLGRTPVTNAEYARYVQLGGGTSPPHWGALRPPEVLADHPVVNVTMGEVRAYCAWLSGLDGREFRLPKVTEWEWAARDGDVREFPWGSDFASDRCNSQEAGFGTTTPVDTFLLGAGPFGLLDQAGNVWEWCEQLDHYGWTVLKGGSYLDTEWGVSCRRRLPADPNRASANVGFRVAYSARIGPDSKNQRLDRYDLEILRAVSDPQFGDG